MSTDSLVLGAVAYDPKVVTIWEGFKDWFAQHDLRFDYILYSNYESQVAAHFKGHYDVAWNSPLAWIEAERLAQEKGREARALAMRDTDMDLTSVIVVKADSPIQSLEDLKGKTLAVGASDSPQATLIPLHHLAEQGLDPEQDLTVQRFEIGVGLHGDHIGGERDAAKSLMAGHADAACMIDGNHLLFTQEGTLPSGATRILSQTATYDDPQVRPLLDLEGLKQWKPGRTSGYALLAGAVDRFGAIDGWLAEQR